MDGPRHTSYTPTKSPLRFATCFVVGLAPVLSFFRPPRFCIRRTTGGTRLAVKWGQRALRYAAVLQRSAAKFALMSMWHVPIEGLPFTHFDSHTTWGGWLIHTQLGWWTQWTAYTWVLVNKVPAALEVMTFKQRGVLCFIFYHQTGSEKQAYQLCSTHD